MSRDPLGPRGAPPPALAADLLDEPPETSLLDLVDSLLDRGVLTRGEAVLGLAGVDLIYLRLSALLCAADRVLPTGGGGDEKPSPRREPSAPAGSTHAAEPRPGVGAAGHGTARSTAEAAGASAPVPGSAIASGPPASTGGSAEPAPSVSPPGSPSSARSADPAAPSEDVHPLAADELDALRDELETRAASPARWNADPENAQRAVAKLVLTLVDFVRQLMERQALRRMEAGTVTADEVERLGVALMRLEETLHEMADRFGIPPEELNLDLGPLGRLT